MNAEGESCLCLRDISRQCEATLNADLFAQQFMSANQTVVIQAARRVHGVLRLPGDKSISHRYAMLAAIAEGKSILHNFSTGVDCASTLECINALGAKVTREDSGVEIS